VGIGDDWRLFASCSSPWSCGMTSIRSHLNMKLRKDQSSFSFCPVLLHELSLFKSKVSIPPKQNRKEKMEKESPVSIEFDMCWSIRKRLVFRLVLNLEYGYQFNPALFNLSNWILKFCAKFRYSPSDHFSLEITYVGLPLANIDRKNYIRISYRCLS